MKLNDKFCLNKCSYQRTLFHSTKKCSLFPEISSGEWNSIFWHFRERGQPCEVNRSFGKFLAWNLRSIWLSSRNSGNFRLNGSLLGKSAASELSGKFPYHSSAFRKFRNFWWSTKPPCSLMLHSRE